MSECLITRLKTSVNDNSLQYFGATNLKIRPNVNNYMFGIITGNNPIKMIWNTEAVTITKNDEVLTSPYSYINASSEQNFKITNNTNTYQPFGIFDFSRIVSFNISTNCPFELPFDLNIFKKHKFLNFCQLLNIESKGDVSVFKNIKSTYFISLMGPEVIGDITSFSNMNLPTQSQAFLSIPSTSITGTIESLVQEFRKKGFTEYSTGIRLGYITSTNKITFNGSVPIILGPETSAGKNILTWTETTITLGDVTVEA